MLLVFIANLGMGGSVINVSDYAFEGPATATEGVPSSQFTVTLGEGTLPSPVTITLHDGGLGGTFSPTSVTLSEGSRVATFTYTPATTGPVTIIVTNDGGLDEPASILIEVSDPLPAGRGSIVLRPAARRWYRRG